MDKYSGKRLDGRYEIQELIGVGGMAYVYKAYDNVDDRTVAIKILKEEFLENQEFVRRFKNESKAIAMLDHPNIVKVYSVSFGDRMQYIVMEYIDGITLKEYMERQETMNQKEILHFVIQTLKAIQHAHEVGIIHRDIKPQNIMLLRDGTIKVTDFGIARFSDSQTRTMTDKAIGSVHYIAPEQAKGELTDAKTDVYSIGVMLYEMLTGQLPFEADNAVSVAIMQLQNDPKPPRSINPSIPIGLEEITLRAMQKNPHQRYQSAQEMLQDLLIFRKDPTVQFHYTYDTVEAEEPTKLVEEPTRMVGAVTPVPTVVPAQRVQQRVAVREPEVEEEQKKTPVGLIIGLCAGGAAVIAAAIIILVLVFGGSGSQSEEIELPNLVGQVYEEVEKQYGDDFEFVVEYVKNNDYEEGVIIDQNPNGGKKVMKGTEVQLTVCSGKEMVEMPDLTNYKEADAITALSKLGLDYKIVEKESDTVKEGRVIKTSPAAGKEVAKGSTVTVTISKGKSKVQVPQVVGDTLETAQEKITAANLAVGEISYNYSNSIESGCVISTNPTTGTEVEEGSTVSIIVSQGKQSTDLSVSVSLPAVSGSLDLVAYLDGDVYASETVVPSSGGFNLTVTGQGSKTLSIYLSGQLYSVYSLNFDNGTVTETQHYQYEEGPSSSESSSSSSSSSEYEGYVDPDVSDEDYGDVTP